MPLKCDDMTEIYIRTDEAGRITAKDEFGLIDEIKRRYLEIMYGGMFDDFYAADILDEALGITKKMYREFEHDGMLSWLLDDDGWDTQSDFDEALEEFAEFCGYRGEAESLLRYARELNERPEMPGYDERAALYLPKDHWKSRKVADILNDIEHRSDYSDDIIMYVSEDDMRGIAGVLGYRIDGEARDEETLTDEMEIETVRIVEMDDYQRMVRESVAFATSRLGYKAVDCDVFLGDINAKIIAAMSIRDIDALKNIDHVYGEVADRFGLVPEPENDDGARGLLSVAYDAATDEVDRESCWFAAAARYAEKVEGDLEDEEDDEEIDDENDEEEAENILESLIADVRSGNLGAMMPDDDCDCGGPVL